MTHLDIAFSINAKVLSIMARCSNVGKFCIFTSTQHQAFSGNIESLSFSLPEIVNNIHKNVANYDNH